MNFRKKIAASLAAAGLVVLLANAPAQAIETCEIGDLCTVQGPQFGCKDYGLIRRWIDLNIEMSREAGETYVSEQVIAGNCVRFVEGDRLRIIRYLGMRRMVVQRPGETQEYIILLK